MSAVKITKYQKMGARDYYGHRWAIGSVVLRYGQVIFHGSQIEANEMLKSLQERVYSEQPS